MVGAVAVATLQTAVIHFYDAVLAQIASLLLAVLVLQMSGVNHSSRPRWTVLTRRHQERGIVA